MDLAFRRRPTIDTRWQPLGDGSDLSSVQPDDVPEDYRERAAAYWDFVDAFDHAEQPDLYRYFGWDPFHDGPIERLRFSADARTLSFRVMYPLIRHRGGGASAHAWFRCAFRGVSWFHMTAERLDQLNDPVGRLPRGPGEPIQFDVSEINTLEDEIARARALWRRPSYSLIIDTFPNRRLIGVVFQQVHVQPEEPLAWELVLQSGEWEIFLYERGLPTASPKR